MDPTNPKEFLTLLKSELFEPPRPQGPSSEYIQLHIEEMAANDLLDLHPETWLDEHFTKALVDLASTLPPDTREEVHQALAIGCVENRLVNASIIANDSGSCFAIVINQALTSMLTHYAKLVSAAQHPADVLFFEGIREPNMPPAIYTGACSRVLAAYGAGGPPSGLEIKLRRPSEGADRLEVYLMVMHLFIIGHELGHYLNGDLSDAGSFRTAADGSVGREFYPNDSHMKEFAADIVAFDLVLRLLASSVGSMRAGMVFQWTIVMFFNFLRDISNRGSETHPPPSTRMLVLAHAFFGKAAARALNTSFNDLTALDAFREALGKESISDVVSRRLAST